jgi:hypothetical protein
MGTTEASGTESRTGRADFQATADPALNEAADRTGDVKLLTYGELYLLWERQQWQTQELDFSRDREDWNDRFDDEERFQRMYGLSSFFIGEQKVAEELGPIMRAAPTEEQRIFLCTQIADEARHVRFFERFYREVGVLDSDELSQMLEQTSEHLNENFGRLFDEMLKQRTERLSAEPEDGEALVEAVTLYHMVIEGMLALTGSTSSWTTTNAKARCRPSSRAFRTLPATSTATSPSAPSSCARRPARTSATSRRSSAPSRRRCQSPTACSHRPGRPRATIGSSSATRWRRPASSPPLA